MDNHYHSTFHTTWTSEDESILFPYICSLREMIFRRDFSNSDRESALELLRPLIGSQYTELIASLNTTGQSWISWPSKTAFDGYMNTLTSLNRLLQSRLLTSNGLPLIHHFAFLLSALNGQATARTN